MSPMHPPNPLCAGSDRHAACFCPVASIGSVSHPCRYSTAIFRILPKLPVGAHRTRLANKRVAGIRVSKSVRQPALRDCFLQFHCLFVSRRGRLVAHHWKSRSQRGQGDGQVQMIRSNDGDKIDGVRPPSLRLPASTCNLHKLDPGRSCRLRRQRATALPIAKTRLQPVRSCRPVRQPCGAPAR